MLQVHISKFFGKLRLAFWLCLILVGMMQASHATTWTIVGDEIEPRVIEKLREKYPQLLSRNDLQNLLRDLGALAPIADARAEQTNAGIDIYVKRGQYITQIDFHLVTRTFRMQLENLSQKYLGLTDGEDVRQSLNQAIEKLLKEHGFTKPKISFSTYPNKNGVRYRYKIDYGYPCLIERINFGFPIPKQVEFGVKAGDVCDTEIFEKALGDLLMDLNLEGYNQARFEPPRYVYYPEDNTMRVTVNGSLGKKIKYSISTNTKGLALIEDIFNINELKDLDPALIGPEAMNTEIRQRYQNRGYDDAEVTGPVITTKDDTVTYHFEVKPGPYYELTTIQFQGATALSKKELDAFFAPDTWFSSTRPLNMDQLNTNIENLRGRYREMGYWSINIREPRITKNKETHTAHALIQIEEGVQRRFSNVQVRGNTVFDSEEIRDLFSLDSGEPFNQSKLDDFEKALREKYLAMGYLYAELFISLEPRSGLNAIFITVNVTLDEGERVKIGDVQLQGLTETNPKVVMRELHFATGDYYDPELIDASRRALLSLGIFQSVQILPADRNAATDKDPVLDLVVQLKEAKPGNVSFGPGWSLLRGNRFSTEASYNNIGGMGRQIFARSQFSEEAHQRAIGNKTLIGRSLSIGYLEPYIFDLPFNATASASNSARADDRWQLSTTGELALNHRFRRFITGSTITTFYGQKITREESNELEREGFLRLLGGNVRTGRIGLRYDWDHRNDITWPTSGFIFNAELSRARYMLGGNLAYKAWQVGYSHYVELRPSTVLAFGFSMEAYQDVTRKGNEADVLPQTETLFVGGAETVRGYAERSLGPEIEYAQGQRQVLGGSHRNYYKLELRQKVINENMALTGFVDTGNVFFADREVNDFVDRETASRESDADMATILDNVPYKFEELLRNPQYIWTKNYTAYGVAFNYLTPLGAINLAYGLPWKRCAGEEGSCIKRGENAKHWLLTGAFHLNIGAKF